MEIRRSYDRLISTMGFPILVRWHLFIESGLRSVLLHIACLWNNYWESYCLEYAAKVGWQHDMETLSTLLALCESNLLRTKGQLWGDLMFSLLLAWTSSSSDLSCQWSELNWCSCDITVMMKDKTGGLINVLRSRNLFGGKLLSEPILVYC